MSNLTHWFDLKAAELKDLIQYEKELRDEIKEILGRVNIIKKEQEVIKVQLIEKMDSMHSKLLNTGKFRLQCSKSRHKAIITDYHLVPEKYRIVTVDISKEKLMQDRDKQIPGVKFTQGKSIMVTKL